MYASIVGENVKTNATSISSNNLMRGQSVWKKIKLNKIYKRLKQIHSSLTRRKVLLLRKKTTNLKSSNQV